MAESVVATAVIGISKLLIQEAQLLGGVSDKVEQLKTEMKRIQCFLKDADKRQDDNEGVRGWVSEIRELAYEAEDVLATFIAEAALRKEKRLSRQVKRYATIFVENSNLRKVGMEIDAIIDKISNLKDSLETYGIKINDLGEGSSSHRLPQQQQQCRRAYSFEIEDQLVGLVDDTKVLLDQLVGHDHKHQRVISICGMGGLGKTTIARKLYLHDEVKRHFDAFAWISVSQTFETRTLLEETLIKLNSSSTEQKEKISKMSNDEVAKELYQIQQNRKCLVILDDIWSEEAWDAIRHAFPIEKMVDIIVLTTRSKILGLHFDPNCYIHDTQCLSEEQSLELFRQKAFPRRDDEDITSMENLGREMVKKCGGLPLAIIALRGILATKDSLDDWNLVYKNVGKYWGKEGDREYLSLKAHLALSYLELPSYLKPCLLHLSQFPEDFSIPTKMLFRLWIAEGIVATTSLNGEETLEDIAKGYLKELVDRSVVQIGKRGSSGKIKSCHLHDLIRELSLSKAKQENYLEIVVGDAKIHSTAHRVVVHTTTNNVIDFDKKSRVRSFIGPWKLQTLQESELMIGEFHMLRVLILKNTLGKWINEIGKLIHLKYLSLDRCGIEYLPSSLRNFRYLQTLFFKTNPGQKKLKISNRIWNFQELSHLEIDCSQCSSKCNDNHLDLGNLRNLRTLRTIGPIYAKGLEKLTNLQKLTTKLEKKDRLKLIQSEYLNGLATLQIGFDSCETIYEKDLERLLLSCGQLNEKELERLFSGCGQLKKLKLDGKIEKLPEYNQNFTPNLTKLTLFNSELKEDPMHVLEKLPELTFLKLFKAFDGEKMVFSSKGFSQLKTLFLDCLDKVMEWQVDEGAMASLCHLRIACCSKLKMVPEGIKYTTNTLSQLDIFGMPYQFCNRVRMIDGEEGEDYYKVRHVPSITILRELW